jgi:hypothetical protein
VQIDELLDEHIQDSLARRANPTAVNTLREYKYR